MMEEQTGLDKKRDEKDEVEGKGDKMVLATRWSQETGPGPV